MLLLTFQPFRRERMSSKNAITSVLQLQQSTIIRAFLQATSKEFAGLTTSQIMNASLSDSHLPITTLPTIYDGHPPLVFTFGSGSMITTSPILSHTRTFTTFGTDNWTETTYGFNGINSLGTSLTTK